MTDMNSKPWPSFSEYPSTEVGWNRYADDWVARRRLTSGIGQIPQTVLEEYRATMQQGRDKGWVESEQVLVVLRGMSF